MSKGNDPAYPAHELMQDRDGDYSMRATGGLTKRELFAAMCLQGLCASAEYPNVSYEGSAMTAVEQADALLAALERTA